MQMSKGFLISKSENKPELVHLRAEIFEIIKKHLNFSHEDPDFGLNHLHELAPSISDAEFNEQRIKIIHDINENLDCGSIIFNAFEQQIRSLVGNDILVQKNCNLVLQMPNDPNPSELHRDAPANSCYEVVVWVPLVDCYRTKAMYILDYKDTKDAYKKLTAEGNWGEFEKLSLQKSQNPNVNFGEALMFSTAVLHGSEINQENQTRVSLNIRFKNIFAPSGLKNQYQFFRQLTLSDFTRIGADLELDAIMASQ